MNNSMYIVLNADIPVTYIDLSVHIHVKFVIRHSVKREISSLINAYTVASALMFVMFVIRHLVATAI
jgi:hypothetical protein